MRVTRGDVVDPGRPRRAGQAADSVAAARAADMAAAAAAADLPEPPPLALQEPPGEQQAASAAVPGGVGRLVAADGVGANLRTDGAAAAASASASVAAAVASDLGWVATRILLLMASLHLKLGATWLAVLGAKYEVPGVHRLLMGHTAELLTRFPDLPSYGMRERPTDLRAIYCSAF